MKIKGKKRADKEIFSDLDHGDVFRNVEDKSGSVFMKVYQEDGQVEENTVNLETGELLVSDGEEEIELLNATLDTGE